MPSMRKARFVSVATSVVACVVLILGGVLQITQQLAYLSIFLTLVGGIGILMGFSLYLFQNTRTHVDRIERQLLAVEAAITLSKMLEGRPVFFGRHAVAPDFVQLVAEIIRRRNVVAALELGSGTTTHYLAALLPPAQNGGYLLSVEESPAWTRLVGAEIDASKTDQRAKVELLCAPLVHEAGMNLSFYDLETIKAKPDWQGRFDLLVVDGPSDVRSRRIAYSMLKPLLSDAAVIVLDDGDHPYVRETVRVWLSREPFFRCKYYQTVKGTWVIYHADNCDGLPLP